MGRKSRLKRERRKAKKHEKPVKLPGSGYLVMALVGLVVGFLPGIAFGKTVLVWFGSAMAGMLFFLAVNRILLFFGFGPNSGSTPAVYHEVSNRDVGYSSTGSSGGPSGFGGTGSGGGGGGGAG